MSGGDRPFRVEYPDAAGYPDGMGFLDEGTAAASDPVLAAAAAELALPRTDRDGEFAVRDRPGESCYELTVSGHRVGFVEYQTAAGRRVLDGVSIEPAFRDRGLGTALLAHVLDDLRDRGLTLTVGHPLVAEFLAAHDEYRDLVDAHHPGLRVG